MGMPVEPHFAAAIMPAFGAIALHYGWRQGRFALPVTMALMAISFGVAGAKVRTELMRAPVIAGKLFRVEVTGFVERVEPRSTRGPRVTIAVRSLGRLDDAHRPVRIRVRFLRPIKKLAAGDAVRFRATLAPPAKPSLPGDFDFSRAAYFQRIGAVGYVLERPRAAAGLGMAPISLRFWAWVQRMRQQVGVRIQLALPGETGALANALMTGERGQISLATLEAYRSSGLLHILSISGLHMAIMGGSIFCWFG